MSLVVVFLSGCSGKYGRADNGFDKICLIYEDVLNDPANAKKAMIEKDMLIYEAIRKHVSDIDAITAFSAVASADPDKKYSLFKQAAEMSLKREWDCKVLQMNKKQWTHDEQK
jgi:hypothetical protein